MTRKRKVWLVVALLLALLAAFVLGISVKSGRFSVYLRIGRAEPPASLGRYTARNTKRYTARNTKRCTARNTKRCTERSSRR